MPKVTKIITFTQAEWAEFLREFCMEITPVLSNKITDQLDRQASLVLPYVGINLATLQPASQTAMLSIAAEMAKVTR